MNVFLVPVLLFFVSALVHFLPDWTRPDLFFGVTVAPAFRRGSEGVQILRQFRIRAWLGSALAILLIGVTGHAEFTLVQVAGFLLALTLAHRETLAHAAVPSAILEIDLSAPRETFPGGFLVTLPPFAALAALAVWVKTHWDQLPARTLIRFGFDEAKRFADRTPQAVYGVIVIHAFLCVLFFLIAAGILHNSRRVSTTGAPAASERRFRRLNVQMLILIAYLIAAQAWMMLLRPDLMGSWWGIGLAAVLLPYMVLLIRTLRSSAPAAPVGDRTPDACWKLGIFYINPKDPSLWVAKRFGIGYTLNFGNRWSWALLGVLLVAVFAKNVLK